jgi:hypothetical protein
MPEYWFWVLFALFWMFMIRPRRLHACHGHWSVGEESARADRPHRGRRGGGERERAVAERDAVIARLEERVRVLERIVTDDSTRLRDEIEALRDKPAPPRG